jgi:colanic acid/amylovoran biosynthesis glycosyltransferase
MNFIKFFFIFYVIAVDIIIGKDPMKIFIIAVNSFPPIQGMAELNHMIALIDHNCIIKIFAPSKKIVINTNQLIKDYNLMDFVIYKDAPKNLDSYDVILAEFGTRGKQFAQYKTDKTKLVTCFRGDDMGHRFQNDPDFYKDLFMKGDLFLPVCKAFKKTLIQRGCPKEKIVVLHSGIDCDFFYYKKKLIKNNEPIKLISVCRLISKKGLEYSINAVSNLMKIGFDIQYTIIGNGILYDTIDQLIKNLKIEEKIKIVGTKSLVEIVDFLHENHIFILPSITAENGDEEGIPNAAKEAMACGLPVILTNHSGNKELVEHGISGLLIEQKSIVAIENALKYLIENKQLWNKFGKAGRKKVEKDFEKNKLNKKLYHLLKKIVKDSIV